MTTSMQLGKTPGGIEFLHCVSSGTVNRQEIDDIVFAMGPTGAYPTQPMLAEAHAGVTYSADARQAFVEMRKAGQTGPVRPTAVVVTSQAVRVMLTFLVRIAGSASTTKFFVSNADAMAWIDSEMAKPAAKVG